MVGRDVAPDVGEVVLPHREGAKLHALGGWLDPMRLAGHVLARHRQQAERGKRAVDERARGVHGKARGRRGAAAAGGVGVVERVGHRASYVGRAAGGHEQHEHRLGALSGGEALGLGEAGQGVAVEVDVLVGLRQRALEGPRGRAADELDHLGVREPAAVRGAHARQDARRSHAPIAEVALLERPHRRVDDEARDPRAVGRAARGTAAVRERAVGKHELAQVEVADVGMPLEEVEHRAAGRLRVRASHHLRPPRFPWVQVRRLVLGWVGLAWFLRHPRQGRPGQSHPQVVPGPAQPEGPWVSSPRGLG